MIRIGITGSLSSGKTTASKIISQNKGPLFSADRVVRELYSKKKFKNILSSKLGIEIKRNFKNEIKNSIFNNLYNLKKLEKIIHPIVRKKMQVFSKRHFRKRFLFFEIPLLIESKLQKKFDIIIFIKCSKNLRLKRYLLKGGSAKLFNLLDNLQIKDTIKTKYCKHVIVNNKSLSILKKNLLNIIRLYE